MDFPTAQMQEKQDVVCHEPTQRPDLGSKKVQTPQDLVVKFQLPDIVDVILQWALRPHVLYQREIKG
jgi:hypothetical protein